MLERKANFLSFRPTCCDVSLSRREGEILNFNINNTIRFLAPLEMTALDSFRSGTNYMIFRLNTTHKKRRQQKCNFVVGLKERGGLRDLTYKLICRLANIF